MKHLVDLDETALARAQAELGTRTIKDTVNAALQLVADSRVANIESALDTLAGAELTDREGAWR